MNARALIESAVPDDACALTQVVRLHTADALSCLAAARTTDEAQALQALFLPDEEPAAEAAIIRYSEADSIHVPSCLTPAAVTIPVAIEHAVNGDAFVKAVAAGTSVGLAIAEAVGGASALGRGIWPTLLAAPAMAAVTACVAARCPPEETANALSLSLAGRSGRCGRPGGWPSGRWYLIGSAVLHGMGAVRAARAGARGDPDLPGADWLVSQAGRDLAQPDAVAGADRDAIARIGLKPFVTARQAATAVQAFLYLLKDGLDPDTIEAVEISLPPETLPVITRPAIAGDRLSLIANLGTQIGLAAYSPDGLMEISRKTPLPDKARDLAARVTVNGDTGLQAEARGGHWPARVRIAAGGRTVDHCLVRLPGDADDPAAAQVVAAKRAAWRMPSKDPVMDAADADALLTAARDARRRDAAASRSHNGAGRVERAT